MARRAGSRPMRWGRAALVISLAVHALVGTMLWQLAATAPRPRPDSAVEITIETRPAPSPPVASPAPQNPIPSVRPGEVTRRRRREEFPVARQERLPRAPVDQEPAREPSADLLRMRPTGERLSLDWGTFRTLEGNGAGAAAPSAAARPTRDRGAGSTAERVAEMLAPTAEDNVRAGKVHPQFYDYLRDARARFHPTLATAERDAGVPKVAGFFKDWWRSYLKDLAVRNGRPDPREPTEEERGAVELTCDVCLTIRLGAAPEIEVVHHSISEELDQEAVTALRFSVAARPPNQPLLPAGSKGDAGTARACYRFSASARRLSPGAIGCMFDEVTLKAGCVWPLKKIFRTDVELVSAGPG